MDKYKQVSRVSGFEKVTGKLKFTADMEPQGVLYAKVKRAGVPSGELKSINTEKAEKIKGIKKIITHKDIIGEKYFGFPIKDHPFLVIDRIRYIGDPIAIAAGETLEDAEKAINEISFEYEDLPGIFSIEEAEKSKIKIHPDNKKGNEIISHKVRKGNVEKGFEEADLIIEQEFRTGFVEHAYIEPEAVLAIPNDDGSFTIYGSMQSPFSIRRTAASILNLPLNKVQIIQAPTGGSFGGKDDQVYEACAQAALLAYYTNRPLKLVFTREESMKVSYKRHPSISKYKIGFKENGKITAVQGDIAYEGGAYACMSPFVTWRGIVHSAGPYNIENVKTDIKALYTNNVYTGAFRGFGNPQVNFAVESLMNTAALKLNIDPIELRRINILHEGDVTPTGQKLTHSVGLSKCLDEVENGCKWSEKRKEIEDFNKENNDKKRGLGVSVGYHGVSLGAEGWDGCAAYLQIFEDGSAEACVGVTDFGAGARTAFKEIIYKELGIPEEKINVLRTDTNLVPDSGPTVASRGAAMGGSALYNAVLEIKSRISEFLKIDSELIFKNNKILSDKKEISFSKTVFECIQNGITLSTVGWFKAPDIHWDEEKGFGEPYMAFSFACEAAEIEVDLKKNSIQVLDFHCAVDVGKIIHKQNVEGQIHGAAAQGLGMAIWEEYNVDKGVPEAVNFNRYRIPRSTDIPDMKTYFVETVNKEVPIGVKGSGELPLVMAPGAVQGALAHSLGRCSDSLPIKVEKLKDNLK